MIATRARLALVLALSVLVLSTSLAIPMVTSASDVGAQSTTTTSSTSTTMLGPALCTPESPCSLLGDTWGSNPDPTKNGARGASNTLCFSELPGNVPEDWDYNDNSWDCQTWTEWGAYYKNNSTVPFTFTSVRHFNPSNQTNTIRVYVPPGQACATSTTCPPVPWSGPLDVGGWPLNTNPASLGFEFQAVATCTGVGDLRKPIKVDCPLEGGPSAHVTIPPGGKYLITWSNTGAQGGGGGSYPNWPVTVRSDMLQSHEGARRERTTDYFPGGNGNTGNYGIGPIGYFGEYRAPVTTPSSTTPPTTRSPLDPAVTIDGPPDEPLASFCDFAVWDTGLLGFQGGFAVDPLNDVGDAAALWHDHLCLLDMALFGIQGLWEDSSEFFNAMLDMTAYGIVSNAIGAASINDTMYWGLAEIAFGVEGLSGLLSTINGSIIGGLDDVQAAIEGLELSVTLDTSEPDSFWGPLLSFLVSVLDTFATLTGTLVTAIVDGFVDLVNSLASLAVTMSVPSPESVGDLADTVGDVELLDAATELALVPGEAVTAASAGAVPCNADMTVNGSTFSLCDSLATTMAAPAWGAIRTALLGGMAFLVLVAVYRRITHHMEN